MFEFTKREYGVGEDVWWNNVLIGNIESIVRENQDIDWQSLREDKTLRLSVGERWDVTFKASSTIGRRKIGIFKNRDQAAAAILDDHNNLFLKKIIK